MVVVTGAEIIAGQPHRAAAICVIGARTKPNSHRSSQCKLLLRNRLAWSRAMARPTASETNLRGDDGGLGSGSNHSTRRKPEAGRRRVTAKTIRLRDKEHCKFVATQSCVVCGRLPSEAHRTWPQGQRRVYGPDLSTASPRSSHLRRWSLLVGCCQHRSAADSPPVMAEITPVSLVILQSAVFAAIFLRRANVSQT